jgi:hypothetical protein
MGFARALHALTRTTTGAIADFRGWEGRYEVWADLDGVFRLSQRRVRQRVRILGIASASAVIVLDPGTGRIHTVGATESANVYAIAIRAHPGRPIGVRTRPVALTQQLLRDLLREVPPDGETYFHGTVRTPDTPVLRPDPEQYEVLKAGLHEVELRFARARDLEGPQMGALFVISGLVLVQTIVRTDTALPPVAPPAGEIPEFDDVTELFIAHVTDPAREILVREGDRIQKGQLLARLAWKDPEFDRKRQHAEALVQEKEAALAVQEGKLRQAHSLVAAGLVAPGAVTREEAARFRAQEAVAQARRELDRVADEARRAGEIRASLDGQVLTVRVHVIHGSEGTAVLRLLYRRGDRRVSERAPGAPPAAP